ncbi:hypothetical protein [Microbacterium sp.]|uniref:hypothetical protein n=1 Tax=Microbacterium sp. TaxID=51671 RepID=UPI0039E5C380
MFLLSWRIKAYATQDELIVRSYLRTYTARYEDVLGFSDAGYAGMCTAFNGTDSWHNMGLRVIEVYRLGGRSIDLSATMMGRRSSNRIEELLNTWVPQEMPPDWVP